MTRTIVSLKLRGEAHPLGIRTWFMGVLNATPDSFYDGGLFLDPAPAVARAALAAGADIVNDISALRFDRDLPALAAERGAAVVLMHMLGVPKTMQEAPASEHTLAP